jgi:predicted  nucleic acid-binding Zn-ribbon protein
MVSAPSRAAKIIMPNKCTKCGKLHPDTADYLLQGCDSCGSRFFFYVRKDRLEQMEKQIENMTQEEIGEIEKDVREIVANELESEDETVVLDLEAIRVLKPGKYMIDVTNLFSQKPVVIRVGPGKYELDLTTLMSRLRKRPQKARA